MGVKNIFSFFVLLFSLFLCGQTIEENEIQAEIQKQLRMMPGQEKFLMEYYQKNPSAVASLRGNIYEEKIIEAIKEICLPHKLQAFLNLLNPILISNFVFRLKNNSTNDNKIAIEAENCGVKPLNIKNNKIKNGTRKNINVKITNFLLGVSFSGKGFKL